MKKILILGSTGFIGTNLVNYFLNKNEYKIFAQYHKKIPKFDKRIKYIKADLTIERNVKKVTKDMDIIIQSAAVTSGSNDIINRPYIHVTENIIMNSLILKHVHINKIKKFIFFSCSVMYPNSEKKLKENDFNYNIKKEYFGVGWTKVYIEKMCQFFSSLGNTKFIVIRHSNIYGQHDKFDLKKSHVIGASINKVLNAKKNILIWGDGKESRDFLYIEDLVRFVELVLKNNSLENFEIFNVGSGTMVSITKLVKKIIYLSKKNLKIRFEKRKPSIKSNICLNIYKARKILSWRPIFGLEEGLEKTINWYKKYY